MSAGFSAALIQRAMSDAMCDMGLVGWREVESGERAKSGFLRAGIAGRGRSRVEGKSFQGSIFWGHLRRFKLVVLLL